MSRPTVRPISITRQVQIDLAIHTGAISLARRDYEAHPISSCRWDGCHELAADDQWCDDHAGLSNTHAADFERRLAHAAASARYRERKAS